MIKQNAVHTNGYTVTWQYAKTSHSNCNNTHSNTYAHHNGYDYHGHGNSCYDGAVCWGWLDCGWYGYWVTHSHYNSGAYSSHYNYGSGGSSYSHTNSGSNQNTNTQTGSTHTNTFNKSPNISGAGHVATGNKRKITTLTIDMSKITYSDDNTTKATTWYLYYRRKNSASDSYGSWSSIGNTTSTSYSWTISSLAAGYYQVLAIASDGGSQSAVLNSNGTFTAHQIENFAAGTSGTQGSSNGAIYTVKTNSGYSTTNDTITYAISNEFTIFRYTPPTWLTDPWDDATIKQLRTEVNTARTACNLAAFSFAADPTVQLTLVSKADIDNIITAANAVAPMAEGTAVSFSSTANSTFVTNEPITAVQALLNKLGG